MSSLGNHKSNESDIDFQKLGRLTVNRGAPTAIKWNGEKQQFVAIQHDIPAEAVRPVCFQFKGALPKSGSVCYKVERCTIGY